MSVLQPQSAKDRARRPALAVYNVHSGVGSDGRFDAERVLEVLRGLRADVVALNEVDSRRELGREGHMAELFRHHLGGELIEGPTLRGDGGEYGNALLTLWPVRRTRLVDISCDGREPRSVIDCRLEAPFGPLRVLVTHLGLRAWERKRQIGELRRLIDEDDDAATILAGDLNEWSPVAPAHRRLREVLCRVRRRGTFPSRLPLLPLDQVWCRPHGLIRRTRVPRGAALRRASDHLPLIAEIDPDVLSEPPPAPADRAATTGTRRSPTCAAEPPGARAAPRR